MDEFISPIDRHRHLGEQGRDECAVCNVAAERTQYLALLALVYRCLGRPQPPPDDPRQVVDLVKEAVAERDRLRAVVAEYQCTKAACESAIEDETVDSAVDERHAWQAAEANLLTLDVRGQA